VKQLLDDLLPAFISKCCKYKKEKDFIHNENLYRHGERRYNKQMDIVSILKSMRLTKMLYRNLLSPEERVLGGIQRKAVISSDSEESNQTDMDHNSIFAQVGGDDGKIAKAISTGKLNKLLQKFAFEEKIESKTARILKGFYTANKQLLANGSEDERDKRVAEKVGNIKVARNYAEKYVQYKADKLKK